MIKNELKLWLQNLEVLKAQVHTWQRCLNYEDNNLEMKQKSSKQTLQVEILSRALLLLDEKERDVIETHLISKQTWDNTYTLFEDKWGIQNGCSIRTLKRMQSRGLQKISDFIESSKIEHYFYNADN